MRGATVVYIVRGLTSGLLKIGCTSDLPCRMKALSRDVEPIELLARIPAPTSYERELHKRFRASLERGREWFRNDGAILAFVETLPASQRGSRVFPGRPTKGRGALTLAQRDALGNEARDRAYACVEGRLARRAAKHGHAVDVTCDECRAQFRRYAAGADKRRAAALAKQATDPLLYPHLAPESANARRLPRAA